MNQWGRGLCSLAAMAALLGALTSHVQAQGSVAVFTASIEGGDRSAQVRWVELLEQGLRDHGYEQLELPRAEPATELQPSVLQAVEEARAIGRAALEKELGAVPADELLARYGERIQKALLSTSAIRDQEGRFLLWNLCVLRVQLLLMTGAQDDITDQAVGECRRRFADQDQFSPAWPPEVTAAFMRHAEQAPKVGLTVQSAPAGCEVLVYGARIGNAPLRTDVVPGPQEVQLRCDQLYGAVHSLNVTGSRQLAIRWDGDAARRQDSGRTVTLLYKNAAAMREAVDHANAFAGEVGAESFVLLSFSGENAQLGRYRVAGSQVNGQQASAGASDDERRSTIERVLQPQAAPSSAAPTVPQLRRHWADYVVGGTLVLGGVAGSIRPWRAFALDGECVNASCEQVYDGRGPLVYVGTIGTALMVGAGIAVLWRAPFGRRRAFSVQAGLSQLQVRGTF